MTEQRAREILLLYRPNSPDAKDPEFSEALELARRSPELQLWFENHCGVQEALRARFNQIAIPAGLKEQIVSEYNSRSAGGGVQRRAMLAVVAALAVVGIVAGLWLSSRDTVTEDLSFLGGYAPRMVRTVLRAYGMDKETNDVAAIRSFLAQQGAEADWSLPKPLERTTVTGCGVLRWQGNPVSMICFHSGRPLGPGEKSDVFLFVVDRKNLRDGPDVSVPQFAPVSKMLTASWTEQGKTYILAVEGDENFLRRFL